MSSDYRFGLVVSVENDGSLIKSWQRCETKYEASKAAKNLALDNPGVLFVSMECHEAFRSEPRVESVWLEYPAQRAVQIAQQNTGSVMDHTDEMPI